MASNVGFRTGARLVTGSQINSENRQEKRRKPQQHQAKLGQRRCCTASLALSAGIPFGTCVAKQVACVLPALENESYVFHSFRVIIFSKMHSFCSNQKLSVKHTQRDDKEGEKLSLRAYKDPCRSALQIMNLLRNELEQLPSTQLLIQSKAFRFGTLLFRK